MKFRGVDIFDPIKAAENYLEGHTHNISDLHMKEIRRMRSASLRGKRAFLRNADVEQARVMEEASKRLYHLLRALRFDGQYKDNKNSHSVKYKKLKNLMLERQSRIRAEIRRRFSG